MKISIQIRGKWIKQTKKMNETVIYLEITKTNITLKKFKNFQIENE